MRTAVTTLLLLIAAASSPAGAGTLQEVLSRNELRVGVALAPPWAMRDDDGDYEGFEIEVARRLAADMEVEVRFLRYDHDRLILALESGEIDLIAAGLTISAERALHVNFSRPYATGGIGMATNTESTASVSQLEDLNDPAFRIGAVTDSVAASLASRVLPLASLVEFDDSDAAATAVVSGDVDVYLEEDPVPSYLALEHPDTIDVPSSRPLLETRSGFAVNKGDPDFVFFLNAWIDSREADTWLPTTWQYWFRTLQWRN